MSISYNNRLDFQDESSGVVDEIKDEEIEASEGEETDSDDDIQSNDDQDIEVRLLCLKFIVSVANLFI